MPLSSQALALLDMVYRVGAPRFHDLSVPQARHSFQKLLFAFRPDAPAVASTMEIPMARDDGTTLLGRLYRPLESRPGDALPLLVYFHGGGWCVGDIESYDSLCRELANESACAVLSVDYRLAPDHPFPAAVDDAVFAAEWAARHSQTLGIDPNRVALGGDSAGGTLSIVASLLLRERETVGVRFLLLIYPCTEIISDRPSRHSYADGYLLDKESLEWFFSRYLPEGGADDWRASPMRAASLSALPAAMLITAEYDPLIDDCRAFAQRVREEGGRLEYVEVAGMVHGFVTLGKFFPEAGRTVKAAAAGVKGALWRGVASTAPDVGDHGSVQGVS